MTSGPGTRGVVRHTLRGLTGALALLVTAGSSVLGQDVGRSEAVLLREAAGLEARGELDGAAAVLRDLLERHPASSGGLFALERVLRSSGGLREILPFADRYLEVDPRGGGARYLKLRVMVELDSLAALEAETGRWIEAEPGSPEPWREASRMYARAFGPERALAFLEEGRAALGSPDALAVEIGDALLELGRPAEAVEAWSRAIGPEGAELSTVLRRLDTLEGDRKELVRPLVDALDEDPTTLERRRAGVLVALESGLTEEAVRLAEHVVDEMEGTARRGFLHDLARRSELADAPRVTLWAFGRLRDVTEDERERRALDIRIAGAALAAADTSRALEAQVRVARGLPPGSAERRRVVADLIRVEAGRADPDELARRLAGFRQEFPDATELDELTAVVAASLHARGESEAAVGLLQGVEGPQSSLERGYVLLADGQVDAARDAFGAALSGLSPARATPVIQLMGLLGRLGAGGRTLVAETAVLAHRGRRSDALRRVGDAVGDLPGAERAAVLAHGARLADEAGLPAEAADLRARLVADHPDAPEAGEATLALARHRASEPGGVEEAVRLLETLILERPDAPVVPDARRELEKLRGGRTEARP